MVAPTLTELLERLARYRTRLVAEGREASVAQLDAAVAAIRREMRGTEHGKDTGEDDPYSAMGLDEAGRLTGLSRRRLYRLMRSGEIDYVKVGRFTFIPIESLRRFLGGKRPE
jgi:excisionase family DNA binding protein